MVQRAATWNEADYASADAGRFARDETIVRRGFWKKIRKFAAQLPFAEDLLAAWYCAFDRDTPMLKAAWLAAFGTRVLGPPEIRTDEITKAQWQVILSHMGASPDEIADVQTRMGRI